MKQNFIIIIHQHGVLLILFQVCKIWIKIELIIEILFLKSVFEAAIKLLNEHSIYNMPSEKY